MEIMRVMEVMKGGVAWVEVRNPRAAWWKVMRVMGEF